MRSKQLAPQLGWIGRADRREEALAYQAFMVKQATESFRRMRPLNPRLAGIMPFTILFHNWSGITSFEQMKPKPAMEQLGLSVSTGSPELGAVDAAGVCRHRGSCGCPRDQRRRQRRALDQRNSGVSGPTQVRQFCQCKAPPHPLWHLAPGPPT